MTDDVYHAIIHIRIFTHDHMERHVHKHFSSISLIVSTLALLISLLGLAPHSKLVADTVYKLSVWTGDKQSGVTLRYLGIIPVASCYATGSNVEQLKRMCAGSRYNG